MPQNNALNNLRNMATKNDAAHEIADEGDKALNNLQLLYELCVWYMQTYGDYNFVPHDYVQPVDITVSIEDLEKENADLEARNQELLVDLDHMLHIYIHLAY